LVGLVERQQQIVEHAPAAAMWHARAEMLAGELADTRGRQADLKAARGGCDIVSQKSNDVISGTVPEKDPADPRPDHPPRRWWQRILFG
jgi:hypothetical protein